MDFCLTKGVQDETPIVLAVKVSFRVTCKEIKRDAVILFWWSNLTRKEFFYCLHNYYHLIFFLIVFTSGIFWESNKV